MKRLLVCLALLALTSCAGKQYTFLEGPPRLDCRADVVFAFVDKPWTYSCTMAGDLSKYDETPIGIEVIYKGREEYPNRSIVGLGLKRVYNFGVEFPREYWEELTGNTKFDPLHDELVSKDDPSIDLNVTDPIQGIEGALNGEFWVLIDVVEITGANPDGSVNVSSIARGRVIGKLDCTQCVI